MEIIFVSTVLLNCWLLLMVCPHCKIHELNTYKERKQF